LLAIVIVLVASRFEQILNYVVSVDVVFFALTAVCVFVFRRRNRGKPKGDFFRVPAIRLRLSFLLPLAA